MSLAFRCAICQGEPMWRIDRRGDAVVSWACGEHLSAECEALQRDWEISELMVRLQPKLREWSEINQALTSSPAVTTEEVAGDGR